MVKIISVMHLANALLFCIFAIVYLQFDDYEEMLFDNLSLLLIFVLAVMNFFALIIANRKHNPLIILLVYFNILYINLRFITLQIYGHSDVLFRYSFNSADTNYSLAYIFFANLALLLGLMRFWGGGISINSVQPVYLVGKGFIKIILFSIFIFVLYRFFMIQINTVLGFDFTLLIFFINPNYFFPLALIYIMYSTYRNKSFLIIILFFLYIFNELILIGGGARGSVLYFVESIFMFLLVLGVQGIRFRSFFLFIILVFIGIFLSIFVFYFSSNFRANIGVVNPYDFAKIIFSDIDLSYSEFDDLLSRVFSRIGFFDINAEIISHAEQYANIFTIQNYLKSFFDNVVSPGFDYFDMPKISRSLIFIHEGFYNGEPSKIYLESNQIMHSDQIGMYGEFYSLFYWPGIFLFFVVGKVFSFIYNLKFSQIASINCFKNYIVLYVFSRFIYSFGIDWLIIESIPLLIILFVLMFFSGSYSRHSTLLSTQLK